VCVYCTHTHTDRHMCVYIYKCVCVCGYVAYVHVSLFRLSKLHLFNQKQKKTVISLHFKTMVFYLNILSNIFILVIKAEFSVFSVTWSFRNHSNMMIYYQYQLSNYYIDINYQTWNFFQDSLVNEKFKTNKEEKNNIYFQIEIFCNNIHYTIQKFGVSHFFSFFERN